MKRILALTLSSIFVLSGCSWWGEGEEPTPTDSPTYNIHPDDLPDSTNPPLVEKKALDAPTEDLGRYSVQELEGARLTAQSYIRESLTTHSLLSGQWWSDGHHMDKLTELGEFSEELSTDIIALNPETGIGAQATQSIALFLTETDQIKATEDCKSGTYCSGEPFYSQAAWTETNDNVIHVNVSASVVRPLLKDGKETHSIDTYNYSIHMSYHEKESEWEINELKNSYTIGKETREGSK